MEFACEFVYVPPATRKSGQGPNVNAVKRSALLPPTNRIRPRTPPPPPPTSFTDDKSEKSLPVQGKITDQMVKNREVVRAVKPNAAFHNKPETATSAPPQQTTPPRKTALLPPNMKPAAAQTAASANAHNQNLIYHLPKSEPDLNLQPWDPDYSCTLPEGPGAQQKPPAKTSPPPLPPRPLFMRSIPIYLTVLPSSNSSSSSSQNSSPTSSLVPAPAVKGSIDKGPLPGNPNVVLISLGKLISCDRVQTIKGDPNSCSQCGSVLDSFDDNISVCYFCRPWVLTSDPSIPQQRPTGYRDGLFWLRPQESLVSAVESLLIFCIDISGSMSITSQVTEGGHVNNRSRLNFVQEAVLHCVQMLSHTHPDIRVGLITFNHQVTVHGFHDFTSFCLSGSDLTDSDYLKTAGADFPSPPHLSQSKDYLEKQILGLSEGGTTALGPAALLAISTASRHPGSKVIICTDGKANTTLGNLEVEDTDARTLLSSTIFYKDLGEYAANNGVTVSVLSIEGTDCRLDELGRLADRTGGTVVIASPNMLRSEFEQIIENRAIATHCSVTLVLPQSLCVRGEREAGHRGTREVGNVGPETEITFQFGANAQDAEAPPSGSQVSIQLQVRYRQRNGQMMLRVITSDRDVTQDSSAVLSSLSLAIIQLNSSQTSAALAVRGRFLNASREGELQRKLIERAIEHNRSTEDKQVYKDWVESMEPIYNCIQQFTRRQCVASDSKSLTDAGAALFYTMKNSNRKTISLKNKHKIQPNTL